MIFKDLLIVCLGFLAAVKVTGAATTATFDFPITASIEIPREISEAPLQENTTDGGGKTEFHLLPTDTATGLFATVVFKEDGNHGLSLLWRNEATGSQSILAPLLTDGVVGLNQRTVGVPIELARQGGWLIIAGNQSAILRVRLDWIESNAVFVAGAEEKPVLIAHGAQMTENQLSGGELFTPPDVWLGEVLDAPLQEQPVALEESVEFAVPMEEVGEQSLLRAKFLGLKIGSSAQVWVNGQMAGTIQPSAPPLSDPGYIRRDGKFSYAGWREGSLLIEDGLLKAGNNSIIIVGSGTNIFLRDTTLQTRAAAAVKAATIETDASVNASIDDTP